jgi:hypothetical protein
MNTRSFLLILLSLATNFVSADAPGKKAMYSNKVSFQNTRKFDQFDFYWKFESDSARSFNSDTSFIIPGSAGRPMGAQFWAVNKKTKNHSDTIHFQNYYDPDYVIILDSIASKLIYHQTSLSNKNQLTDNAGADEVENKDLVKDAKKANINHLIKMIAWGAASAIAFILLVWLFIRRKHRLP